MAAAKKIRFSDTVTVTEISDKDAAKTVSVTPSTELSSSAGTTSTGSSGSVTAVPNVEDIAYLVKFSATNNKVYDIKEFKSLFAFYKAQKVEGMVLVFNATGIGIYSYDSSNNGYLSKLGVQREEFKMTFDNPEDYTVYVPFEKMQNPFITIDKNYNKLEMTIKKSSPNVLIVTLYDADLSSRSSHQIALHSDFSKYLPVIEKMRKNVNKEHISKSSLSFRLAGTKVDKELANLSHYNATTLKIRKYTSDGKGVLEFRDPHYVKTFDNPAEIGLSSSGETDIIQMFDVDINKIKGVVAASKQKVINFFFVEGRLIVIIPPADPKEESVITYVGIGVV